MAKPEPSDWGKLSGGQSYIFWSIDMARAIFGLGLGENVSLLLWHVIETSWGPIRAKRRDEWPDPIPCRINFAELSRLWGIPHQRLYDARKWLVKSRILLETEEGFWVNKDAPLWVHPTSGEPLLSPEKLAYALAARTRKPPRDDRPLDNVVALVGADETNVETLDTNGQPLVMHASSARSNVHKQTPTNVQPLENARSNVSLPIEERTREEGRELIELRTNARGEGGRHPKTGEIRPAYPDGDGGMWMVFPGPHALPEEKAREIFAFLWDQFGRAKVCIEFYQRQQFHTLDVWRGAIRDAMGKAVYSLNYIETIACDIESGGGSKSRMTPVRPLPADPDLKEVHRCTPERAAQIEASYRPKKQRDYRR